MTLYCVNCGKTIEPTKCPNCIIFDFMKKHGWGFNRNGKDLTLTITITDEKIVRQFLHYLQEEITDD